MQLRKETNNFPILFWTRVSFFFFIPKYRIVLLLLLGLSQFQRGLEGSALLSKRQQLELLASEPVLQLGLLNPNVDIAEVKKKRMKRNLKIEFENIIIYIY